MWSWKTRARHKPLRIFLHTQRQPSRRCRGRDNTRTTCASEDPFHFYHEDILLEWNSSYTIDTPITIIQVPCRCLIFSLLIIPQEYIFLYFTLSRLSPQEYIRLALNFIHATRSACLHLRSFCQRALLIAESLIMGCAHPRGNTCLFLNKSISRLS